MLIVDLSSNQGSVRFPFLKNVVQGCWHKATEGITYKDREFDRRRAQAAQHGLRFGAYHFARPDLHPFQPEAEAANFCKAVGKVHRTDLRPVLDFETHSSHLTGPQMTIWARAFNKYVQKRLGLWPMFYSYPSFMEEMHAAKPIGNGLWLASFSRNDGKEHSYRVPAPWKKAAAHQFTSNAHIPGVTGPVDLSHALKPRSVLAYPWLGR